MNLHEVFSAPLLDVPREAWPALGVALLFMVLGGLQVARVASSAVNGFWRYFLRPSRNLKSYGDWAVVTGCTDGIGKAYAELLAGKKMNLILVSRTPAKLDDLKRDLVAKHGIEAETIPADLTKPADATFEAVTTACARPGRKVGLLINNAGMSYPHAEYFDAVSDDLIADLVAINVTSLTRMVKAVLPGMLARRRGAIVNLGSAAGSVLPTDPLYAVYAASKAYAEKLSACLDVEYREKGIHVQLQAPLYVVSKMSKIRKPSLTVPTPKAYARAGLACIGRESVTTPYWAHALMWWAVSAIPVGLMNSIRLGQCKSLRARWYRKNKAA
ncbi:unnamed protein product [Pedinophyceae sp. YPF-701]|nr:unnamed protein product [Pedinophyceae sp. YPF-701]